MKTFASEISINVKLSCPRAGESLGARKRYLAVDKELRKAIMRASKRARRRPPPNDESGYFYICEECGQAVDKRSAVQIFHHEELAHRPLTEAELTELSLEERAWEEPRRGRSAKP